MLELRVSGSAFHSVLPCRGGVIARWGVQAYAGAQTNTHCSRHIVTHNSLPSPVLRRSFLGKQVVSRFSHYAPFSRTFHTTVSAAPESSSSSQLSPVEKAASTDDFGTNGTNGSNNQPSVNGSAFFIVSSDVDSGYVTGHTSSRAVIQDDSALSKKNLVYLVLCGIFFTNAIMGELTGGKFFQLGPFMLSIGTLQWPVVFLTTDLLNEYFGGEGVKAATYVAVGLLFYVFAVVFAGMSVPAAPGSPITDQVFQAAFGQSLWIIFGSVTAFFTSQLVDMSIFLLLKEKTGSKMLWLRATGSTIFSQMIDSFIVGALAFWLPGKFTFTQFISTAATGYTTKLILAVAFTPLIYAAHALIDSYLGEELAHDLVEHNHPLKHHHSDEMDSSS
mmetsp:Transcript_12387/g.20945  ORF Transcript_12387/g.20945 Transcript_12387/m.20945 type:complete len:388 (-) Transcript_12387:177-1340(-)